jgi:hypothetical protein
VEEWLDVRFDVFNIIFAHKNTDYKVNTHLSPPQNVVSAFPNYSKARRSRRMEEHEAKASKIKEVAPKSWFCARSRNLSVEEQMWG